MKVKFVFDAWKTNKNSKENVDLLSASFHSGTIFEGEIYVQNEEKWLLDRIRDGYNPYFYIIDSKKIECSPERPDDCTLIDTLIDEISCLSCEKRRNALLNVKKDYPDLYERVASEVIIK